MIKKRRLSDFGDSFFLIALGVFFFFYTRNPELMSQDNTIEISGVLGGTPKSGVHDESQDYIGFKLNGDNDFYEFTRCSYNDYIAERINSLNSGDSVAIRINRNSSSLTYPWSGEKYRTYRIVEAYSPKHGKYVSLERYNECLIYKSSNVYPILSIMMVLMGFFQGVKRYNDKLDIFDTKYLDLDSNQLKTETFIKLHPNKLAFLLKQLPTPIILLIIGSFLILSAPKFGDATIAGLLLVFISFYIPLHFLRVHRKIYYILDEEGIHFKNVTPWMLPEIKTIRYDMIEEVECKLSLFEEANNIGTVVIYSGKTDDDGNKEYDKIIGIKEFLKIEEYIKKMIDDNI